MRPKWQFGTPTARSQSITVGVVVIRFADNPCGHFLKHPVYFPNRLFCIALWVLVRDQYDGGGISGGTLERPGLKRLLVDIEDVCDLFTEDECYNFSKAAGL